MTLEQLVVTIAIELTAIAVVLIVGAVILMEKEEKRGGVVKSKPVRDESEWVFPLMRSKVIYWVPVEERLPENMSLVLVTICAMVGKGELVTTTDVYSPLSGKWRNYNGDVIAWAELPEPYKK